MELFTELLKEFISEYGAAILYTFLTALAGYLGIAIKKLYTRYINDQTAEGVVKTCVKAVEQMYKDLHGEEKMQKALKAASDTLSSKGITATDSELRLLIESSVAEFNNAFNKTK